MSRLMYVGEQVRLYPQSSSLALKTRLEKLTSMLTSQVFSERERNGLRGAQSKGCCQACTTKRISPVWTQYIAIFTVHDDPRQCEHVLSQYFVIVTWCVTVT